MRGGVATSDGSAHSASRERVDRSARSSRRTSAKPGNQPSSRASAGNGGSTPHFSDNPSPAGRPSLSPIDRFLYDRKRMKEIFEFDYGLEMYKPAAKRRWGYYALPILYGDRLIGKLDAHADRKAGVLRVAAIHQDVPFSSTIATAVDDEINDLARWLDLELDLPS